MVLRDGDTCEHKHNPHDEQNSILHFGHSMELGKMYLQLEKTKMSEVL